MQERLVDLEVEVRGETDKALRVFDGTKSVWLPKAHVQDTGDGTITLPEWLALDKELI